MAIFATMPVELHPHRAIWFRGQSELKRPLEHSLARQAAYIGLLPDEIRHLEQDLVRSFQAHAHRYLPVGALPTEDEIVKWWILIQHYGGPTRLLDWTLSPWVALYFACEGNHRIDGAVWFFTPESVPSCEMETLLEKPPKEPDADGRLEDIDAEISPRLCYVLSSRPTDRMVAQQTCQTACREVYLHHDKVIEASQKKRAELYPGERETCGRIRIPWALKRECLLRLRQMNVTALTLFPGLDGLGRSLSESVRLPYGFLDE